MPLPPSELDHAHAGLLAFLAVAYVVFVGSGALPSERAPARRAPRRVLVDRVAFAALLGGLPVLVFRLLGRPLPGLGLLSWGVPSSWAAPTFALSLLAGAIAYFAPKSAADRATYPQYLPARWTPGHVALEIVGWALYLFAYEAIFRGILLTILLPVGTATAIAAQTALYAFAHFPKSQKETQGSLFFGVIASVMTLGWGTIWPAFLVHLALALGNDWACARGSTSGVGQSGSSLPPRKVVPTRPSLRRPGRCQSHSSRGATMSEPHDTSHILQSLASNVVMAAMKFGAAFFTGSGALLAEALHTSADSANQVLLLIGVHQSRKPPDTRHPLGYGRELYYWSFLVALFLFSAGGLFSIYEGVHKLSHPEPITRAWLGFSILGLSLVLEIFVVAANVRQINGKRGERGFVQFVRESKESDLIVVFGENTAAFFGSIFALAAFFLSWKTGDGRFDAGGSILVGMVLVLVAVFLVIEVKSLLIGESADADIAAAAERCAIEDPLVDSVSNVITLQQGPGEVLVALKVTCAPTLTAMQVSRMINGFEARLREKCPQARWIFVEPDLGDGPASIVPLPVDD